LVEQRQRLLAPPRRRQFRHQSRALARVGPPAGPVQRPNHLKGVVETASATEGGGQRVTRRRVRRAAVRAAGQNHVSRQRAFAGRSQFVDQS
jgi:hypothetical protein